MVPMDQNDPEKKENTQLTSANTDSAGKLAETIPGNPRTKKRKHDELQPIARSNFPVVLTAGPSIMRGLLVMAGLFISMKSSNSKSRVFLISIGYNVMTNGTPQNKTQEKLGKDQALRSDNDCTSNCKGAHCITFCEGSKSTVSATGFNASSMAYGVSSTSDCSGPFCRADCDGSGYSCTTECTGEACEASCGGNNCKSSCKGPHCKSFCTGNKCKSSCEGANCRADCAGRPCENTIISELSYV